MYSVVIVASGKGERLNLGYNKVYYKLNDNITILEKSMSLFLSDERCNQVIVVTNIEDYSKYIGRYDNKIVLVNGGDTRQASVYNGLVCVINDVVLIHDGARPFLSKEVLDKVIDSMNESNASCVMIKEKDTIKLVENGYIIKTINRDNVRHAQTPQAFRFSLIWSCINRAIEDNFIGTDDTSLIEKYSSEKIKEVIGDENNIKITNPFDLKNIGI